MEAPVCTAVLETGIILALPLQLYPVIVLILDRIINISQESVAG